ncbi:hypothetical protein GW915_01680 [bacterium]|nr:hypothetical protein [bacterium]
MRKFSLALIVFSIISVNATKAETRKEKRQRIIRESFKDEAAYRKVYGKLHKLNPEEAQTESNTAEQPLEQIEESPDTKTIYDGGFIPGLSLSPEQLQGVYQPSSEIMKIESPDFQPKEPLYHPWSTISGVDPNKEEFDDWQKAEGLFVPLIEGYLHYRHMNLEKLKDVEAEKAFASEYLKSVLNETMEIDLDSKNNAKPLLSGMIQDYIAYQSKYFDLLSTSLRKQNSPAADHVEMRKHAIDSIKEVYQEISDYRSQNWSKLK